MRCFLKLNPMLILAFLLGFIADRIVSVLWNAYKKRPYDYSDCCEEDILKNWLDEK